MIRIRVRASPFSFREEKEEEEGFLTGEEQRLRFAMFVDDDYLHGLSGEEGVSILIRLKIG